MQSNYDMPPTPVKTVRKILIVDDDLAFVKLLKESLWREGYTVFCGFDGHMALDLARVHRPDMILLDVNMPYMDGLKAFERLRSNALTSLIPIVFISEMGSDLLYPVIQSAPRAAHLKKPIDLVELTSFMRHFIEEYVR